MKERAHPARQWRTSSSLHIYMGAGKVPCFPLGLQSAISLLQAKLEKKGGRKEENLLASAKEQLIQSHWFK